MPNLANIKANLLEHHKSALHAYLIGDLNGIRYHLAQADKLESNLLTLGFVAVPR